MATPTKGPLRRFRKSNGDVWAIQVDGALVTTWFSKPSFASSRSKTTDLRSAEQARAQEVRLVGAQGRKGFVQFGGAKLAPAAPAARARKSPAAAQQPRPARAELPVRPTIGHARLDATLAKLWKLAEARDLAITLSPASAKARVLRVFGAAAVPPSFASFARVVSALRVTTSGEDLLWLLSPSEMVRDTRSLVRVPKGVSWEDAGGLERPISTDHLVAFAGEGAEARWCFSLLDPRARGELAVFLHHQDEPTAARDRVTGAPINRSSKPAASDFPSWLASRVHAIAKRR